MSKVYLINTSGGQWEDAYTYPLKAFLSKEKAELELQILNHELRMKKEKSEKNREIYHNMDCCNTREVDACEGCQFYNPFEDECDYSEDYNLDEQHEYSMKELELVE